MLRATFPAVVLLALAFAPFALALETDVKDCPPLPLDRGACGVSEGTVTLEVLGACDIYMQGCGFRNHAWLVATACTATEGYLALSWQYLASDQPVFVELGRTRATGDEACPYADSIAVPVGSDELSASWECVTAQAVALAPTPSGAASRTACYAP